MVSGQGPKEGNGGLDSPLRVLLLFFYLNLHLICLEVPFHLWRDYWLEPNLDGIALSMQMVLYCQGCNSTSNISVANNGWWMQIFLLVVLISITATCPAFEVAYLQFTTTPDGKLLCAADSTKYDPFFTSFDNCPVLK